jgi:hypothetical protein
MHVSLRYKRRSIRNLIGLHPSAMEFIGAVFCCRSFRRAARPARCPDPVLARGGSRKLEPQHCIYHDWIPEERALHQ